MLTDRPSGDNCSEYLPWWCWAAENLNSLIEPDVDWQAVDYTKSGWYKLLDRARSEYEDGKESGVIHLAHLINLAEDLNYLREAESAVFDQFKAALASNMTVEAGYLTGKWFEVRSACLLSEAGISFSMPDPPDYQIRDSKIGLECHSPRIEEGGDVYGKTVDAIQKKGKKYYGQPWFEDGASVLMLDATWLVRAEDEEVIVHNDTLPEALLEALQDTVGPDGFDLVIAFLFGHAIDQHSDERAVSCVYAPDPVQDEELRSFKDQLLSRFKPEDVNVRLPDLPS